LLAEVAEDLEFKVESIENARQLSSNPQQKRMMNQNIGHARKHCDSFKVKRV